MNNNVISLQEHKNKKRHCSTIDNLINCLTTIEMCINELEAFAGINPMLDAVNHLKRSEGILSVKLNRLIVETNNEPNQKIKTKTK